MLSKLLIVLSTVFLSQILHSEPVTAPHVEVQLMPEQDGFQWGKPFRVAVHWTIEPEWHLYWRNPGDSGEPPKFEWKLPEGFTTGKTFWPVPHSIAVPPLRNYGYEKELTLVTEIIPPKAGSALGTAPISLNASWLVCQESCIPGQAVLTLEMPAMETAPNPSTYQEIFQKAQTEWPSPHSPWQFELVNEEDFVQVRAKGTADGFGGAYFFADDRTLFRHAEDQKFEKTPDGWALQIPKKNTFPVVFDRLSGVLVVEGNQREAFEVEIVTVPAFSWKQSLYAILGAFLGGLILNLMPCVFPILCLKVLSVASLGGAKKKQALLSSVAYSMGILVSFWCLAGVLLVLRAGGEKLGWGFQLQSPYFLIALSCLLLMMALNFFGTFEVGGSWTGAGQGFASKEGWAGAFFSGVLATLVATPCTAPFMGTAMGFAFTQSEWISLLVFTSLALGLASPYVLLALSPALVRLLPRPGQWMVTLKQGMGFLLLLTVLWLVSVLGLQVQLSAVFFVLLGMLGLSFAGWMWGVGGNVKRAFAVVIAVLSFYFSLQQGAAVGGAHVATTTGEWLIYAEDAVEKAVHDGEAVFIDFTAAWCITCQVNERVALETDVVQAKFKEKKVRLYKADWTNQDAGIAKKLESYGRQGVPLYVLYPGGGRSPMILPQILTPQIVLDELEKTATALRSKE